MAKTMDTMFTKDDCRLLANNFATAGTTVGAFGIYSDAIVLYLTVHEATLHKVLWHLGELNSFIQKKDDKQVCRFDVVAWGQSDDGFCYAIVVIPSNLAQWKFTLEEETSYLVLEMILTNVLGIEPDMGGTGDYRMHDIYKVKHLVEHLKRTGSELPGCPS